MSLPEEVESRYYAARGFDPEHARAVRSHYLPFLEGRELLVELGAGRGELLELAAGRVGRVVGVDADAGMCRVLRDKGLEAVQADASAFLGTTELRPDVVVLAHLIEHLPVDAAFDLLTAIAEVTPPAGRVIVVTPNPACLAVLTNDFWSDPTHARLYTTELLEFLVSQAGFDVVESGGNPRDVPGPPPEMHAPDPLPPGSRPEVAVEPRATIEIDDGYRVDTILDELARLRSAVEGLVHGFGVLADGVEAVRHQAETTAARFRSAFDALYGANEIYVVGDRRA